MIDAKERSEQEAAAKARRRAEQASIIEGLRTILEGDEQLLAFARGRIAGGWKGKLSVGPEAFFAPFINIALTERRFILQHIHPESGKPSEITPHFFSLASIAALTFSDLETFGAEPEGRLTLRLYNEQQFRMRVKSQDNFDNARTMVEVFQSLTKVSPSGAPTQRTCSHCKHVLDQPAKFCPYCGQRQAEETAATAAEAPFAEPPSPPAPPDSATLPELSIPPVPPEPPTPPLPSTDAASDTDSAAATASTGEGAIDLAAGETPATEEPAGRTVRAKSRSKAAGDTPAESAESASPAEESGDTDRSGADSPQGDR